MFHGKDVAYTYDALGNKLGRKSTVGGIESQQDYIGGIEYSSSGTASPVIERIATEDGFLLNSSGTYSYYYNLTDHLGNVRSVLKKTGTATAPVATVMQKQDYYPFGKTKSIATSIDNKYLYNGKEMQADLSGGTHTLGSTYVLEGQLDYGARFYDAEIGRWNVVDPQAEKDEQIDFTPYHYGYNNPVKHIDPDGEFPLLSNIVGAVAAAGVEYGSQVAANIYENGFSSKAFTKNIDAGDILIAAGEGFLTSGGSIVKNAVMKGTIKVGAEVVRNAVDFKNGKLSVNSVKSTAINTAVGLVGGKIAEKIPSTKLKVAKAPTPKEAVKSARLNGPVNRAQRIAIQTQAKAQQTQVKVINATVNGSGAGIVVGAVAEKTKRKIDGAISK